MNITRQDALDFLNNNIYYAEILETAEKIVNAKLTGISCLNNKNLALLCEDFGYNEDVEIEINII